MNFEFRRTFLKKMSLSNMSIKYKSKEIFVIFLMSVKGLIILPELPLCGNELETVLLCMLF